MQILSLFEKIKKHKFVILLLIIILFLLFKKNSPLPLVNKVYRAGDFTSIEKLNFSSYTPPPNPNEYLPPQELPPSSSPNRLVIENSDLSLLVKDVKESANQIMEYAKRIGGFMVSTSIYNPNEQGTANMVIRVPSSHFKETLNFLENLAVKVVYENLYGEDVTDQYTDIKAQLATLYTTKAKFEAILEKATEINDLLNVQREIINLQNQIDNLKGRELYLEKSSQLSKITIYLATDELELPYTPKETWRAEVIFKTAVRSLVRNLRDLATLLIWIGVYSIIWLPMTLILFFLYKRVSGKKVER